MKKTTIILSICVGLSVLANILIFSNFGVKPRLFHPTKKVFARTKYTIEAEQFNAQSSNQNSFDETIVPKILAQGEVRETGGDVQNEVTSSTTPETGALVTEESAGNERFLRRLGSSFSLPIGMDFDSYLKSYGATEIMRFASNPFDGQMEILASFPNGVVLILEFQTQLDEYLALSQFNLYVYAEPQDPPEEGFQYRSEWSKTVILDLQDKKDYYVISPENIFFGDEKGQAMHYLIVPENIEEIFQQFVIPYLELDHVPFEKDPFARN